MEKLSLNISPESWGHLVTKYDNSSQKLTVADFTEGTVNVESDVTGSLTKRKGGPNYNATLLAAAPKDQFEAIFSDGTRHLLVVQSGEVKYSSGDTIFNTVVNGTGFSATGNFEFATTQDRVYGGNGINSPQVYDRSTSYGGVSYSAPRMRAMGAQAPGSAPTVAVAAGGNVPVGAHTYKVTFVYYDSEESNGGPASAVATTTPGNQTVNLTSVAVGGYGVTARKIYRDDNDGLWLHVGTIANNTATTFSDTVAVGATPTEIPTDHDTPPSFSRITLWLDQLWVSGVPGDPSTLFYSDTSMPDIFPGANQVFCNQEDPITAHVVYFDRLVVFNRRSMGQILGKTSDTYRYAAIPSSVGCVDNRTLQIRVIEGVPILIWLSDRGFYSYDGNSINRISDQIEDLVNFNIQQALQQKNSVSQSSFSGTAENGIDSTQLSSLITTRGYLNGTSTAGNNPRRNWDDQGDWEGGSVTTNIRTKDGDGSLRVPTRFAVASFADGSHSGTEGTTSLTLPVSADASGESVPTVGSDIQKVIVSPTAGKNIAYSFVPTRSGTLTDVIGSQQARFSSSSTILGRPMVWNDLAGTPGTVLFTGTTVNIGSGSGNIPMSSSSLSIPIVAGQRYWFGFEYVSGVGFEITHAVPTVFSGGTIAVFSGGSWLTPTFGANGVVFGDKSYAYCATAIPSSGIWTSAIYDSLSAYVSTTLNITHTGTYTGASQCSGAPTLTGQTIVEGSDIANFAGGAQVTETLANVNGSSALTISGKRYWRIKITLSSSDDRVTPTVGLPTLTFNTTATWESESIDTTLQSTVYNSLVTTSTIPAGTSVTITIATSALTGGPWGGTGNADGQFGPFGSHIVRQFVRIRAVLTTDGTNATSPTVASIVLKWTISAKYTSTIIDTGVNPPAGWDLFLSDFTTNGGTVSFEMRSATTSGGIPAATFYSVTPGEFPTVVAPNQFTQWRVTIVSSDEDVPEVDSVTVQWFTSTVNSIRPASIFTDGRYYVSLASLGSLVNDIILQIDIDGKWRRMAGLSISTFSFFFNRPYFGLATTGRIRKFLDGVTDAGVAITFDWRTKAFDYSTKYDDNTSKVKVVGEVVLNAVNTGATYQTFYSVDAGETFIPLYTNDGLTSYASGTDGKDFFLRLRPLWDGSNEISGRTIMYRVYSSDVNEVEVHGLEVNAFVRKQTPVITG